MARKKWEAALNAASHFFRFRGCDAICRGHGGTFWESQTTVYEWKCVSVRWQV